MKTNSNIAEETSGAAGDGNLSEQELYFPAGLLGFPACHRYRLERFKPGGDDDSPFFLLNALEHDLSFPVIQPHAVGLQYQFPVDGELLSALSAHREKELLPLLIVTVRQRVEDITLNLQGPLIINPGSSLGLQLIIEEYPLRYPLLRTRSS